MARTHGYTGTTTHAIWVQMRRRCQNPKCGNYSRYGGRGIRVCERWDSFENFLADMGERPLGMSIERRDNDGNYEPDNCYWATFEEQNNNRRNVELIEFSGKSLSLRQWSRELGIAHGTLYTRRGNGLTGAALLAPKATPKPAPKKQTPVLVGGETKSLRQAALDAGLKYPTVYRRVRSGLSIEQALQSTSLKTGETL